MKETILFDNGVPRPLRKFLSPHRVTTTQELGWDDLQNGKLLRTAQDDFDVIISTDTNIKYAQRLEQLDIALLVLRSFRLSLKTFIPLVPQIFETIEIIESGEVVYIYADEQLIEKDQRKGKCK
jgi:hypothetical protein